MQGLGETIWAGYRGMAGRYDEAVTAEGVLRGAWEGFAREIAGLGEEGLRERTAQLGRLLREHGLTYNLHAEEEVRQWAMDVLPLVLSWEESVELEAGLGARAGLLSRLHAECYGARRLLGEGVIPAEMVYGNPRYLRPLVGVRGEETPLQVYAADVVRSADGRWWVVQDSLESPNGLGYSLENRSLSLRIYPRLMRALGVLGQQGYVEQLSRALEGCAPLATDDPQVVLLGPGPGGERFHEQSYLARNFGYPLAEGTDLLVRDGRLQLKTVRGIAPVDVLLRWVPGALCDPLELDSESLLGVPGLVDCVRGGRLAVVNSLGAGLLQASGWMAFLPGLSQRLDGGPLALPSVATWWCGQPDACAHVMAHLEGLVLRRQFGGGGGIQGWRQSAEGLRRLRERIQANPGEWVGQEPVERATVPVYVDGRLEARPYTLRLFLMRGRGGWKLLPGGMARMARRAGVGMADSGEETLSKDVWILGGERRGGGLAAADSAQRVVVRRAEQALTSRVADNLFWMGRYAERTEQIARAALVVIGGILDEGGRGAEAVVEPFMRVILPQGNADEGLEVRLGAAIRDRRVAGSLVGNLVLLREAARSGKERLSMQMWQQLQRLAAFQAVAATRRPVFGEETQRLLEEILEGLSGLSGLAMENMTRGEAWLFMELGRRLERTDYLARLLRAGMVAVQPQWEEEILRHMILCADSGMSSRRRYLNPLRAAAVLELLVIDTANPRSIGYQLARCEEVAAQLPDVLGAVRNRGLVGLARSVFAARSAVALAEPERLAQRDERGVRAELDSLLGGLCAGVLQMGQEIENQYFAHAAPLQSLGGSY